MFLFISSIQVSPAVRGCQMTGGSGTGATTACGGGRGGSYFPARYSAPSNKMTSKARAATRRACDRRVAAPGPPCTASKGEPAYSRTAGSKGDTEGKAWAASSTAATCCRYHGAYSHKRLGYSRTGVRAKGRSCRPGIRYTA